MVSDDDADGATPEWPPPSGPLLPPDDRLWRHPSELGAAGPPRPVPPAPPTRSTGGAPARPHRLRPTWGLVAAAAACGAVAAAGVLLAAGLLRDGPTDDVREWLLPRGDQREPAEIAEDLLPSIVHLEVAAPDGVRTGTGLVFRDDGHVLTAADLVDGAHAVTAVHGDGEAEPVEVVGADATTDLAVVKLTSGTRPAAPLGATPALQPGEATIVIEPAPADGRSPAVTRTVVGATGARLQHDDGQPLYGMVQLNSASSIRTAGAVVVDQHGAVVGLTTARRPRAGLTATSVASGVVPTSAAASATSTWATPIDYARKVADDLITTGAAQHVWMGIEHVDSEVAGAGARVYDVVAGSPAHDAGLVADDVVVRIAGRRVRSMDEVIVELRTHRPGDAVEVEYRRGGDDRRCSIVLAPPPG